MYFLCINIIFYLLGVSCIILGIVVFIFRTVIVLLSGVFGNHLFYKQNIFIYKYFLVVILYTYYFVTGLLCIILGVVIWVLDLRFPELVTNFFGVDPLQDDSFVQGKSVLCHTSIKLWCVQFLYRQWCQIWVGPQIVFAILTVFFKTQIWKFSSNIILSPMFKDP